MRGKPAGGGARSSADESSEVAGIALLASAIGNLWQASKRADLAKDRDHLLGVLRQWQAEHSRLAVRLAALAKAYEGIEGVARTQRDEIEQLKRENREWQAKYHDAERRLGKVPAKAHQEARRKQQP